MKHFWFYKADGNVLVGGLEFRNARFARQWMTEWNMKHSTKEQITEMEEGYDKRGTVQFGNTKDEQFIV